LTLILLANFMVPTVQVMPLPVLLGITLVHQILFLALCLGVVGGQWRRASVQEVVAG
jgi:hypothetical protein